MLLGLLLTVCVPPGATIVLGADDTVERRFGRTIRDQGCDWDAVRSTKKHVIRCFGLKWVSMMRLVPGPWSRRGWGVALFACALLARDEARPAPAPDEHRLGSADDQTRPPVVARPLAGVGGERRLCGGVAGPDLGETPGDQGLASARGCRMASSTRPPLPGTRGPNPLNGKRQRSLQEWAVRSDTPWETVEVHWYGGQRKPLWVFSRTALWETPRQPPDAIRYVLVADPEGTLRMAACCCPDLQATPVPILPGVVMRWSLEVTFEESRAHLGLETQRQWSDRAIARTTPVLLALFSLVTVLALKLGQGGQIPLPVTAWYRNADPTFADCLALVRRHLWRALYVVHSTPEAESIQFPPEEFNLLIHGVPLAA